MLPSAAPMPIHDFSPSFPDNIEHPPLLNKIEIPGIINGISKEILTLLQCLFVSQIYQEYSRIAVLWRSNEEALEERDYYPINRVGIRMI